MKNNANFLFVLLAMPFVSFADYSVQLPLELNSGQNGGSLPSGSIVFSGEQDEDPYTPPYNPENDPKFKVCFDKKPEVISIIESYGGEFRRLHAYFDEEENDIGCVASYIANGNSAFIKPALVAIGVYTAE
jgi:hypothetical protein